jgi:hypothetical protein
MLVYVTSELSVLTPLRYIERGDPYGEGIREKRQSTLRFREFEREDEGGGGREDRREG